MHFAPKSCLVLGPYDGKTTFSSTVTALFTWSIIAIACDNTPTYYRPILGYLSCMMVTQTQATCASRLAQETCTHEMLNCAVSSTE